MKFYNEKEQPCLETDVLGVSLGVGLLQVKDRMWFPKDEACGTQQLCITANTICKQQLDQLGHNTTTLNMRLLAYSTD